MYAQACVMARWQTFRIDEHPDFAALPREYCTLTMIQGPAPGAVQPVGKDPVVLGRDPELPCWIDDRGMSRRHARVFTMAGQFFVQDLESTNGTRVNGMMLDRPHQLRDGDRIQVGENTVLRVALLDAQEHEAQQRMFRAAITDPLTGLCNRGYLDDRLASEFAFAHRHRVPLAVLFLDLDHFKRINDNFGHAVGDEALRRSAEALRKELRQEDLLGRYGGEEFILVARGTERDGASTLAERLRQAIADLELTSEGKRVPLTVSVGVAVYQPDGPFTHPEELVAAADRAVYRAKEGGRDRVSYA